MLKATARGPVYKDFVFGKKLGIRFFVVPHQYKENRLLSRAGIVEEDERRWKKMEGKKNAKMSFFKSVGDHLGTLVGVQRAPKKIRATRLRSFFSELSSNLSNRFARV